MQKHQLAVFGHPVTGYGINELQPPQKWACNPFRYNRCREGHLAMAKNQESTTYGESNGFRMEGYNVDQLIAQLEAIRAKHGGEVMVINLLTQDSEDNFEPVTECCFSMAGCVSLL